jgi:hypothetical protein
MAAGWRLVIHEQVRYAKRAPEHVFSGGYVFDLVNCYVETSLQRMFILQIVTMSLLSAHGRSFSRFL